MYITINEQHYAGVTRRRSSNGDLVFSGTSLADLPDVKGIITTFRDDGFELVQDDPAKYMRIEKTENTIRLTNQPEPEEVPEETELSDTEILNILLGVRK